MEVLLINIGHPRTGTGYMTTLYQAFGLNIGHEVLKSDGISDWAFCFDHLSSWTSPDLTFAQFKPKYLTYNVRDPWTAIPSIHFTIENAIAKRSEVINLNAYSGINRAVFSLLEFDRQVRTNRQVDYVIRIEHAADDILNIPFMTEGQVPIDKYNTRPHRDLTLEEWKSVDEELLTELDGYCQRYGYPTVSSRLS